VPLSEEPQEDSLAAARRVARLVIASFLGDQDRIGIDRRDDLVEILVEHWWSHAMAFNKDGTASRDTFMRAMFRNKLLELRAATVTAKRGGGIQPFSLEAAANPQDAESDTTLADTVVDRGAEADVEAVAENNERQTALIELRPYLAEGDWELLEALWQDPRLRPASERLGVHHSTVYARVARIRSVAEERGLRQYL